MPGKAKLPTQSQESEDNGVMEIVAKQMQTSWEKKRKEQEQKFLDTAKLELLRCGNTRADEFFVAVKQMESIHEQFIMDYASICDEIRHILTAMLDEQITFAGITQRQYKSNLERGKEREKEQVRGLAIAKKAIQDYSELVDSLGVSE